MELTEPTLENLRTAIDGHLVRGVGYRHGHLVGATRYVILLLLDSPENHLPLSEIMVHHDDTEIRIWWGQCTPSEPMELLCRRHRHTKSEPGTPAPFAYSCGGRDNRDDLNPNTVASEEPEVHLESDSADGSNGGQRESSATAAKPGGPRCPKLPVRSELTVQPILPVQTRPVPGPRNDSEIASQNTLPEPQCGGRSGCPKLPLRSEPTVRPKLPVRRRLVLGPRDGREIKVGKTEQMTLNPMTLNLILLKYSFLICL